MNNNLNTSCYLGDHGNYETGVVCLFCKSFSNTMKLHKIPNQECTNHILYILGEGLNISKSVYNVEQFTLCIDLKSCNFSDVNREFIVSMVKQVKLAFPEKLKICYIHNPPAILKYIYSIIRLIVDKRTFKKFTIIKDNKVVTNQDYLLN